MSETCYFCDGGEGVLESHHIVPRRHGGTDEAENLVDLCPTCHEKLERLYDRRFYSALGVEKQVGDDTDRECAHQDCTSTDTRLLSGRDVELAVCDEHRRCSVRGCGKKSVTPVSGVCHGEEVVELYCSDHKVCNRGKCANTDVSLKVWSSHVNRPFCDDHTPTAHERGGNDD